MSYFKSMRDMVPYVDPSSILKYFAREPLKHLQKVDMQKGIGYELPDYSLFDYMKTVPKEFAYSNEYNSKYHNALLKMAQKLVNEGLLTPVGDKTGIHQNYRCNGIDETKLRYGYYDFLILGFPEIKYNFEEAVRPLIVIDKESGDESIGTSFAILYNYEKQYLITARHCVPQKSVIAFNPFLPVKDVTIPLNIFIPDDDRVDIAVLEFSDKLALSHKFFELDEPYLLDKVMTIGYPPIQGVKDAVQISSTGEITAITETYWHGEKQILISSRVKGGNSGSPVINNMGYVVGLLTNTLIDIKDSSKPDELGFGIALSSETLINLIRSINGDGEMKYKKLQVFDEERGFSIK